MAAAPCGLIRRLHLAALLLLWSNANAQNIGEIGCSCRAPNGQAGQCYPIYSCDAHKEILRERPLTSDSMRYLLMAQCGLWNGLPFLCCPNSGTVQLPAPVTRPPPVSGGQSGRFPPVQVGSGTTTPPTTAVTFLEDRFGEAGFGVPAKPTTSTTAKPFLPSITGDRLVNTGVDVDNHPNWKYLGSGPCGEDTLDRIIVGEEANLKQFPWIAVLQYRTPNGLRFLCGGSVISERYVLTAAHCVTNLRDSALVAVRLGEHNTLTDPDCIQFEDSTRECGDPAQDFKVAETIVHPYYRSYSMSKHHDIALIRLDRNVNINDYVMPICLPKGESVTERYETGSMFVAGWDRSNNRTESNVKLWAHLNLVNNEECQSIYQYRVTLHDNQMCARSRGNRGACIGDSGGPLMQVQIRTEGRKWGHYLATGLLSLETKSCGTEGVPAVYTRIGPYMNWILDSLRP